VFTGACSLCDISMLYSRDIFAEFGKWQREKVFANVFKYTELYKYLNGI